VTRLRKMMLEELQRRNYSQDTTRHYIRTVEDFARRFKCPPDRLGPRHIREYQAELFQKCKLSPGTVTNRLSALRFFATARPIPRDAPATIATFFITSPLYVLSLSDRAQYRLRAGTCNQSYGPYESAWDCQARFLVFCATSKCGYRQSLYKDSSRIPTLH
jgi:integrase-like protein